MDRQPEVAYYYRETFWGPQESGWAKSLLLFFDQIAILLPHYMYGLHSMADPATVIPLEDRGLLRVLEPNDWIDQHAAESLAESVIGLLADGAFDDLPDDVDFKELSNSRMGHGVDVDLSEWLVDELAAKGLARSSQDSYSVPLHPVVRTTILAILGQLSRSTGARQGLSVHPATNDQLKVDELIQTLSRDAMPSADKVITLDLEPVSFDLGLVPLDDVLDFRDEHRSSHRAYVRDLRRFLAELADIDDLKDRERALAERRNEIAETAHDLQRSARHSLGKNLASFAFGLTGAVWGLAAGQPLGFALTAADKASSLIPSKPNTVSAYTYTFEVKQQFSR